VQTLRFLILTAVLPEARAIARAFSLSKLRSAASDAAWEGPGMRLVNVGPRALRLDRAAAILDEQLPQAMILAGLAGALDPALKIGDVVMAPPPQGVPALPGVRVGTLCTAQDIIATPAEKARLFQESGCAAVEMEAAAVVPLAARAGVPLLSLRAISDTAGETLDARFLHLVDPEGRPRAGRAARLVLAHPTKLPELLRLQRATAVALAALTAAIGHLAASDWPAPRHRDSPV
jgi:adenosylhomocysteine nucleosidase